LRQSGVNVNWRRDYGIRSILSYNTRDPDEGNASQL